jgi:Leucine-rich repeat (LRR) protein
MPIPVTEDMLCLESSAASKLKEFVDFFSSPDMDSLGNTERLGIA